MKYMWLLLFTIVPLLGFLYTEWRIWHVLPFCNSWRWAAVGVVAVAFSAIFLNFGGIIERMPLAAARICYETGYSTIFVLLYAVIVFLLLDIGRLIRIVPRNILYDNGYTSLAIFIVLLAVFVYGNIHYNNKEVQRKEFVTTKGTKGDSPLRIVMMSDMHLGYHNNCAELARWVNMINAEKPDIILIGGDIIDLSVRPLLVESMAQEFRRLKAPVYACLGNHEYYCGEAEARKFYSAAGITLLCDSVAYFGNNLCIAGCDDRTNPRRKSVESLLKNVSRDKYIILLDHQPYKLERAERAGVDFQFSGHTHHGQVWPISWITEAIYEKAYGSHRRGATQYYVSSGIGIWGGKFRIGTCSEYLSATLSFGQK